MELTTADLEEICAQTSNKNSPQIPVFKEEWEEEYEDASFQSLEIKVFALITSLYYSLHFLTFVCGNTNDGAGGTKMWVLYTWLPELISAISGFAVFFLFTVTGLSKLCKRRYEWISAHTIILSYLAAITPMVMLEIRRSRFQRDDMAHIAWGIDYSAFPPRRTCNDTDPLRSLESPTPEASSVGCNSLIVSGNLFSIYILHNLLPRILRNQWPTAVAVALATAVALVAALIAVGTFRHDAAVISAVLFQLLSGLGAAYFCHLRETVSREHFAVAKGTKFATEQDRNLLYTLMPRDVVQALQARTLGGEQAAPPPDELLGREVLRCTVMFCALEPQVRRSFALLPGPWPVRAVGPGPRPSEATSQSPCAPAHCRHGPPTPPAWHARPRTVACIQRRLRRRLIDSFGNAASALFWPRGPAPAPSLRCARLSTAPGGPGRAVTGRLCCSTHSPALFLTGARARARPPPGGALPLQAPRLSLVWADSCHS